MVIKMATLKSVYGLVKYYALRSSMRFWMLIVVIAALPAAGELYAHSSGCHRWHSCSSDSGSYACGDLGYCSGCSDNQYCVGGRLIAAVAPESRETQAVPPDARQRGVSENSNALLPVSGLLAGIIVQPDQWSAYSRDDYHRDWSDADSDCQNARHEVLIAESIEAVTLSNNGCKVTRGLWYDHYTGQHYTNPSELDIDHFVPLAEAHRSGADQWSQERRHAYAQDITNSETLIAVSSNANRSKRDHDPAEWIPEYAAYHCQYIRIWVEIKRKWQLSMDPAEYDEVVRRLATCTEEAE